MVQIAAVYDLMGDPHGALEWFERLNMRVPQDPGVLARLGALHARYTKTFKPCHGLLPTQQMTHGHNQHQHLQKVCGCKLLLSWASASAWRAEVNYKKTIYILAICPQQHTPSVLEEAMLLVKVSKRHTRSTSKALYARC